MGKSCCGRPIARIIKVANFETGLVGLEDAFRNVYESGLVGDDALSNELLKCVKDAGNYISSLREGDYKQALLREYRAYESRVEREKQRESTR